MFKALSLFFSKYNACIFTSRDLFLLIWKRCLNSYYIFDPNGRDEDCERDFEATWTCYLFIVRGFKVWSLKLIYRLDLEIKDNHITDQIVID